MHEVISYQKGEHALVENTGVINWENIITQFIAAQEVSALSKATYLRQIRQFVVWLTQVNKAQATYEISRGDLLQYKEYLLALNMSSYTVSGYITVVRKLFEWLESIKLYPNIARGLKGTKKAKGFRKDCLTVGQIKDVLCAIDRNSLQGLRNYALINLLVRTGLRTVEIARARIEDLRQESGEAVLWIQGKGRESKDDFVLLVDEALRPLREYLSKRKFKSATEPLFASLHQRYNDRFLTTRMIRGIVKESFRKVGLDDKRLTAHSLRHTAISLSIKGGASLVQAQAMARHIDPKTTMVYFHNQARIKSGAEKFIKID